MKEAYETLLHYCDDHPEFVSPIYVFSFTILLPMAISSAMDQTGEDVYTRFPRLRDLVQIPSPAVRSLIPAPLLPRILTRRPFAVRKASPYCTNAPFTAFVSVCFIYSFMCPLFSC
ncbi:hypothetical protein F4604DRAFT_1763996 [Suillus subluteus]|nr:hypothetical protein F4604DRAFT_1763996 [Suillus subluteus]